MNGKFKDFSNYLKTGKLNQIQFGALLLLHELGHVYGELGGKFLFFKPDAESGDLNKKHTQQVIDACFSELGDKKKKKK